MEELLTRHRKETRDLQSRITQKKKQASKKSRKSTNDECETLENELKRKHQDELTAFHGETPPTTNGEELTPEQIEALTLQVDDDDPPPHPPPQPDEEVGEARGPRKPNRQKARLARRAAEQESVARQAAEEARNLPDLKTRERERMVEAMEERGLVEKEIRADGHCLFSAVADQLVQLDVRVEGEGEGYQRVRMVAADFIEGHGRDFEPFLEEGLEGYVRKVRETAEWGGQVELMALARSLRVDICVLQDFGRVERFEGGGEEGKEMWLGYYKHGFGLGEHYNSLRKKEG